MMRGHGWKAFAAFMKAIMWTMVGIPVLPILIEATEPGFNMLVSLLSFSFVYIAVIVNELTIFGGHIRTATDKARVRAAKKGGH